MLSLWLRLMPLLLIGGLAATLAAGAVGRARAPVVGIAHLEADCGQTGQPCWFGILPGQPDVQAARDTLEGWGYRQALTGTELSDRVFSYRLEGQSPGCVDVYFGYQIIGVKTVVLHCLDLRAGDLLAALGAPTQRVSYDRLGEDWVYGAMMVRLARPWASDPGERIDHIRLVTDVEAYTRYAHAWHGLVPRWRFCLLEPAYRGCALNRP